MASRNASMVRCNGVMRSCNALAASRVCLLESSMNLVRLLSAASSVPCSANKVSACLSLASYSGRAFSRKSRSTSSTRICSCGVSFCLCVYRLTNVRSSGVVAMSGNSTNERAISALDHWVWSFQKNSVRSVSFSISSSSRLTAARRAWPTCLLFSCLFFKRAASFRALAKAAHTGLMRGELAKFSGLMWM